MTTSRTASQLIPGLIAWAFFAVGIGHALTIWTGSAYLMPGDLLMLAVGLAGGVGLFILGLLLCLFWAVLGMLLALLAEGSEQP